MFYAAILCTCMVGRHQCYVRLHNSIILGWRAALGEAEEMMENSLPFQQIGYNFSGYLGDFDKLIGCQIEAHDKTYTKYSLLLLIGLI
jgi:hypothetical protein